MSGKGKTRTIQTQLKPCPQAQTTTQLTQVVDQAPAQLGMDVESLKLDLLSSLKEDIAGIMKKELQEALGEALSPIKVELQAVKQQLACDRAANDAKLAKLSGTVGDIEEALTGCTDDIVVMKSTIERLTTKIAMLEDKSEDLESRSRRNNIRIIGVAEGTPTAVATLLKEAFGLDKAPIIDRSHRTFQPTPKPGERPRAIVCRLHYYSDCNNILRQAKERQRIKVGDMLVSVFPDYTAKVTRARAAFNDVRRLLRSIEGVRFGLLYPAQLRVTYRGVEKKFTSAEEAKNYVKSLISG